MDTVECVLDCHAELAEGPVWDPEDGVLYWVNIKDHEIHRYDPATGQDRHWTTPTDVGSLALRSGGGMVVALRTGFFFFDPANAQFTPIAEPERDAPENRFNDGRTDRQGRFWAGSLHDPETAPTGSLYRLDTDLSCHKMVEGIYASNGLAFSPDSATAYFADSPRRTVWAWDFDQADGALRNRRVFIELRDGEGAPDGADKVLDADGLRLVAVASIGCSSCPSRSRPASHSAARAWTRSTSRRRNTACRRRSCAGSRSRVRSSPPTPA